MPTMNEENAVKNEPDGDNEVNMIEFSSDEHRFSTDSQHSRHNEHKPSSLGASSLIKSKSLRELQAANPEITQTSILVSWVKKLMASFGNVILKKQILNVIYIVLLGNGIIMLIVLLCGYEQWIPFSIMNINNWILQTANLLLLLSYTSSDILFLRLTLGAASVFFIVWGFTFDPLPLFDVILWNYIMGLINIKHAISLFYGMRPIGFDHQYEESMYKHLFEGIMSRGDCKALFAIGLFRELRHRHHFCKIGDNITSLSILVKGKIGVYATHGSKDFKIDNNKQRNENLKRLGSNLNVTSIHNNEFKMDDDTDDIAIHFDKNNNDNDSQTDNDNENENEKHNEKELNGLNGNESEKLIENKNKNMNVTRNISSDSSERQYQYVNTCLPNHFIDSAEYIMNKYDSNARWKVDLIALQDCCYITWPREILDDFLNDKPHLKQKVLGILGIDVTKKLLSQQIPP